jgi:tetratricopeptide (TPR) repeat protein
MDDLRLTNWNWNWNWNCRNQSVNRRSSILNCPRAAIGAALALLVACSQAPSPAAESSSTQNVVSGFSRTSAPDRPVTYNQDIAPILFDNCATCHRPAQSGPNAKLDPNDPLCIAGAPFSLLDYASARAHADEIAQATLTRAMPPWLPETGHGEFANTRRLSDRQVALIQQWVQQGAQQGDPAHAPKPPSFPDGWQLGTPDLVVRSAEAYTLRGKDEVFRTFVFPVPTSPTRHVRAIEFRADNPRVLHHANVAVDPARVSRGLDRADPGPGFAAMPEDAVQNVFGWSPGKVPILEPEDTAWTLDEGSDLVVQLHMVPGARPEIVQPSIGLFFTSAQPTRVPVVVKLESKAIDIPAGASNHVVEDSYVLPADVNLVSVYPHAHYLAREMSGTATLPNGTVTPLLLIKQWDIRWQDQYRYREPLALPKGTTLRMRFTYDNSAANPRSPKPTRRVVWGQNSTDEMGALWVEVIPQRPEDAGVLTRDYVRRAQQADLASAELRVRVSAGDPAAGAAAHNGLAMQYVRAGRLNDARQSLEEALRLAPQHAEAHSNLGTVLQMQGRMAEAAPHLERAVRLAPNDDRVRFNFANGLIAAGRVDEAVAELRRAIAINPDNEDAHFNLAMIVGPRGQVDEAILLLRRVIEINPRNAEAHRNLSVALGLRGHIDEAIRAAQTALRIQPDSQAAREQLDRLQAARRR